jgi:hypothetical protein
MGAPATTVGTVARAAAPPTRRELIGQVDKRITITQWLAHLIGCVDVVLLLFFVLPDPAEGVSITDHVAPNAIAMGIYLPIAMVIGTVVGHRISPVSLAWIKEDREPTPEERQRALKAPNYCFKLDVLLWLGGVLVFFLVNITIDWHLAVHTAWTAFLGGITTCAIAHLLLEKELRPVTAIVLAHGPPVRPVWPGIEGRIVLAWLLATGGGLLGLITVGIDGLIHDVPSDVRHRADGVAAARAGAQGARPRAGRRPGDRRPGVRRLRGGAAPERLQLDGRRAARA